MAFITGLVLDDVGCAQFFIVSLRLYASLHNRMSVCRVAARAEGCESIAKGKFRGSVVEAVERIKTGAKNIRTNTIDGYSCI